MIHAASIGSFIRRLIFWSFPFVASFADRNLQGCVVTLDALGCRTEIVEEIAERRADYVISLKGNQGVLYKDVKE